MGPMLGVKLTGFKGLAVRAGTMTHWEPLGPWEQENKHFPGVCVYGASAPRAPTLCRDLPMGRRTRERAAI